MLLGKIISKIRKEKNLTKTELSNMTNINIGHLTHIEKSNRNPSYSALKDICAALKVPVRPISNMYHQPLTDLQEEYNYIDCLPYNKVPVISNIEDYIECPYSFSNAAFAFKMPDSSMSPLFPKNSYVFIEPCGSLENKDIGLFKYNDSFVIRRLLFRGNQFILKANNKNFNNLRVTKKDDFIIIGKAYL